MTSARSALRVTAFAVLFSAAAAFSQQHGSTPYTGPIPSALRDAKTVFVSNGGSDSGLFPEPFSGDPSRSYSDFYSRLAASGAFQLVNNPSQADLVLELQLTAPNGPSHGSKQFGASDPVPMFRLTVYDRRSHYVLWTETASVEIAFLQSTHDRNFDQALDSIVNSFLQVAGHPVPVPVPAPAQPH